MPDDKTLDDALRDEGFEPIADDDLKLSQHDLEVQEWLAGGAKGHIPGWDGTEDTPPPPDEDGGFLSKVGQLQSDVGGWFDTTFRDVFGIDDETDIWEEGANVVKGGASYAGEKLDEALTFAKVTGLVLAGLAIYLVLEAGPDVARNLSTGPSLKVGS